MSRVKSQRARRIESVAGVVTSVVLNAMAVLLATRLLGAAGRGQMVALGLASTVVHVVLGVGLPGANVYFAARSPHDTRRLIGNSLAWCIVLPVAAWGLVHLLPDAWIPGPRLDLSAGHIRLAILLTPPIMAFQQMAGVVQGLGRFRDLLRGRALQGGALLAGIAVYPLFGTPTPFGLYVVWAASYGLGAAAFVVLGLNGDWPALDLGRLRDSLRYGVRAMWTQVWEFVNMRGDQVIVAALADAKALGVYSIAVSLSEVLFHVPNAVSAVVFSDAASGEIPDQHRAVSREAKAVLGMTVAGGAIVVLGTQLVVVPLLRLGDERLALVLGIMVVPVAALASARLLGAYVMGRGRPDIPSIAAAVSFGVTVAADLYLVPRFGALGAAMGVSVGYTAAAIVTTWVFAQWPKDDDHLGTTVPRETTEEDVLV